MVFIRAALGVHTYGRLKHRREIRPRTSVVLTLQRGYQIKTWRTKICEIFCLGGHLESQTDVQPKFRVRRGTKPRGLIGVWCNEAV